MKYVVFRHRRQLIPVIVPDHCAHSQVKIADAEAVSAGFFHIADNGNVVVDFERRSTSTDLAPDALDGVLLTHTLGNFGIYAFLESEARR